MIDACTPNGSGGEDSPRSGRATQALTSVSVRKISSGALQCMCMSASSCRAFSAVFKISDADLSVTIRNAYGWSAWPWEARSDPNWSWVCRSVVCIASQHLRRRCGVPNLMKGYSFLGNPSDRKREEGRGLNAQTKEKRPFSSIDGDRAVKNI